MSILGIDLAIPQGHNINWAAIAASDIKFVFCKATENLFTDPTYLDNYKNARNYGLVKGSYHFARLHATSNDAINQAEYFSKVVLSAGFDALDLLALDLELAGELGSSHQQFIDWTLSWLERVKELCGAIPLLYTGGPFFNSNAPNLSEADKAILNQYPLWLAAYVNTSYVNNFVPTADKTQGFVLWQQSGDIAASDSSILLLPGTNIHVDRDVFKGSLDDLKAFAGGLHQNASNSNPGAINSIISSNI